MESILGAHNWVFLNVGTGKMFTKLGLITKSQTMDQVKQTLPQTANRECGRVLERFYQHIANVESLTNTWEQILFFIPAMILVD